MIGYGGDGKPYIFGSHFIRLMEGLDCLPLVVRGCVCPSIEGASKAKWVMKAELVSLGRQYTRHICMCVCVCVCVHVRVCVCVCVCLCLCLCV